MAATGSRVYDDPMFTLWSAVCWASRDSLYSGYIIYDERARRSSFTFLLSMGLSLSQCIFASRSARRDRAASWIGHGIKQFWVAALRPGIRRITGNSSPLLLYSSSTTSDNTVTVDATIFFFFKSEAKQKPN
jgi:hypothetical protein